jgi:DNA end-binding protein Ku
MATMVFPDEIIDPATIDEIPTADDVEVNKRELAIAEQLVESLAAQFEPEKFHDTYREDVLALIERKAAGEQIAVQPDADEADAPVPDLMSALKASLDAVKAREGNGAGTSKAKPAAKKKEPAKRRKDSDEAKKEPAKR